MTRRLLMVAIVCALIVVGVALRAALFATSVGAVQPSSDESIQFLLAQHIRAGGTPLLFLAQPYLFPIESYLMAPFINFLPPNAWGTRIPVWIMHLAALGLMLRFLWRAYDCFGARVCGAALLLIPSSYVLLVQAAYSMPGYASLLLGGAAVFGCAMQAERNPDRSRELALIGFIGGLGFASHQLILVFAIPAAVFALMLRPRLSRIMAAAAAVLVGLIPYLLAKWKFPGAHAVAEQTRAIESVFQRLWNPALTHTLPVAMGWRQTLFPDEKALPAGSELLKKSWPWLFAAMAALFVVSFFSTRWVRVRRGGEAPRHVWLRLDLRDLPWLTALLNLVLFAAATRAHSSTFRYLLPSACSFPLLVADLIGRFPRARLAGYAATCCLLVVNVAGARTLLAAWRDPNFAEQVANVPDLNPALDYLRAQGIHHAIASYGAAYRINVQSAGLVVCAQPQNERFPGWPIPYEDRVWEGDRIAYVLTDRIRFLKPDIFERHLFEMGVKAAVHTAGAFRVFHDFISSIDTHPASRMRNEKFDVAISSGAALAAFLVDRNPATIWTTTGPMRGGEWIEARWADPVPLDRVVLVHGFHRGDTPVRYTVRLLDERGGWLWEDRASGDIEKFELYRGHPRYGRGTRTFRFDGRIAHGIRFEIETPRPNRNWTVAELEVYVRETGFDISRE